MKQSEAPASTWIEGHISIEAVLQAGSREVKGIYCRRSAKRKRDRHRARLQKLAAAAGVPFNRVEADFIAEQVSGKSHGGIIAEVGPRQFVSLADLIAAKERPFIVMLDGIEDPFNFGQAVRALYAAGADGLVVRPRNWLTAAGVVARASAGATEYIRTAVADTVAEAAAFFREHGLQVACTSRRQAVSMYEADLTGPLLLLLGGEKRGITRSFLKQADVNVQIPYGREAYQQSLGTAAAAAVLGFEIARQRTFSGQPA